MFSDRLPKQISCRAHPFSAWLKNTAVTLFFLSAAFVVSTVLLRHTGEENNSALVFTLAVACISLLTSGYVPGILASLLSAIAINVFFMYPYARFNLTLTGYPVAFISFVCIACIVSTLTSRVKLQAAEARRREQHTRQLFEQNQTLIEEKRKIELEAARESIRSNILRAVSHDLRTPLTAISGAASVLLEGAAVRSEQDVYLMQDIRENADWLTAMVENLLSVTRIQQSDMHLNKTPEVLEEVAGDALLKIRRRFPACTIALILPDELLIAPMEPTLITQVIMNLLENAIRHSGDREHITLTLSQQNNRAVITVSDRGCGIPEDILRDILQGRQLPVCDTDTTRGMGIGLSACHSIIKAHGGSFTARNQTGGGAQFQFELPLETEEDCHV